MPIELNCPGCGQMLRVGDETAGKKARCPKCGSITTVPGGAASGSPFPGQSDFPQQQPDPFAGSTSDSSNPFGGSDKPFGSSDKPFGESENPFSDKPNAGAAPNPYMSPTSMGSVNVTPRTYRKPHRGAMVLTMGILGLLCCAFLGIAAWIMASQDLGEMRAGVMDPSGKGLTVAGMVLGIVATCLLVLNVIVYGIAMVGGNM